MRYKRYSVTSQSYQRIFCNRGCYSLLRPLGAATRPLRLMVRVLCLAGGEGPLLGLLGAAEGLLAGWVAWL